MGPDTELSGDYGYDMAHEDLPTGRRGEPRPAREQGEAPVRVGDVELDGDLSYDTSHDF